MVCYIVFSFCWFLCTLERKGLCLAWYATLYSRFVGFFCILEKKGLFGLRVTDRHQGKPRQEAASRNHEGTLLTGLPTLGPYIQPRPPAQAWHCPRGPEHPTVSKQEREHTGGGTSFTEAFSSRKSPVWVKVATLTSTHGLGKWKGWAARTGSVANPGSVPYNCPFGLPLLFELLDTH